MEEKNLIPTIEICRYHEVEPAFIGLLKETGLLVFEEINHTTFIPAEELRKLEKIIRLHNELEINIAGIEAISHLLERIEQMQEEIRLLRNLIKS